MSAPDKLLTAFALFTLDEPEWSVEAAAERLGIGLSTAYRFFKKLSDAGLISTFSTGRYVLGPAIVELDRQSRLLDPLIRVAQPVMKRLVDDLRVPGVLLLCRLFRKQVMCIHQESFRRPATTVSYERGRPMPLYRGAASKVILAHLPPRTVRAYYESNRPAMIEAGFARDWDGVKGALRAVRNAPACFTFGELDPGMTGVAVPLKNAAGIVDASLGFVLQDSHATPKRFKLIPEALNNAANGIAARLSRV